MPGYFSPATLEQIRSASDIVDVIGAYLPLKRAGANFVALCPFHKEKTPSFSVNPHLQIFKCFGCHKGGDVFSFVKEYESIDFPEAVRRLAERAKIALDFENRPGEQQTRHLKESLLQIHEQIAVRWQNALANEAAGQPAREYLARRGVSSEAIKLFRLGAAPDTWDDTVNWARNKGYELGVVEKAGLILRKEGSDSYYDRFRGRLMFPICDEQGRVIGFSGRILGDEKTAKYVNSPETPIFIKSKVFFGLDKSKRAILDAGHAIICEGQLDLIACFMAGIQNIVAPQGTAFTSEHARILKRYVEEVILCFDADEAGQNAMVRALDSLLAAGLAVRVAVVPAPHDPDSFIKAQGAAAFKASLEKAEGFFDFYLNRLCALNDSSTDKGRLGILHGMAEAVHKTANIVLIDKYAQKTALRLGVTPDAVRAEFKKMPQVRGRDAEPDTEEQVTEHEPLPPPSAQEQWLLKLILLHQDLVPWAAIHIELEWIPHPAAREIVVRRLKADAEKNWTSVAAFLSTCDSNEMMELVTNLVADDRPVPDPPQQLADVTMRLRNQFLDRRLAELTHRAAQPDCSDGERLDYMRQQQEIRSLKRKPLA